MRKVNFDMEKWKGKISRKTIFLTGGVLVVAVCGFIVTARTFGGTPKEVTVPPSTSGVERGSLDQRVSADGTTVAADEYSIFIELSQEVDKVYAEVGDKVEEGQLLVTYDIADTKMELENKLAEAKISLQNAQIALNELSEPASGTELIDLKSQVVSAQKSLDDAKAEIETYKTKTNQAETALKNAQTDMENNEELLTIGGVSQSDYDKSVEEYENAVSSLNEAKQNLQSKEQSIEALELALEKAELNLENGQNKLNDKSTYNSYVKQQNTVKTAQMNVETAQNNLDKLTEATYSPISGTVIESNAVEGQMLTDSTVMMKVADLTNLDVEAYVSEYDIAKIQVGQKVEMTSDGIEDKIYTGTVTKIEPTAESRSTISGSETTVPIVVHMDNPDELVKPGFSFDMEIIVIDLKDVTYIPVSSVVVDEDDSTCVFVVENGGTLKKTEVELGTYSDMYVELISGLSEGDMFMTSPDDTVKDGASLMDYATGTSAQSGNKQSAEGSILDSVTGGGMGSGRPSGGMQGGGGMPGGGGGGPR